MSPTRVLHVSQPTEAGLAAVLLSYLGEPDPKMVQMVACPTGGELARDVARLGHEHLPWAATREPGRTVVGESLSLKTIVRDLEPDVVHLHCAKAGLAGRLAIRGEVPTVFQPHAWSFSAVRGITRAASLRWERHAQQWTHATVCVSEAERNRGRRAGVLRSEGTTRGGVMVPNIIDPGRWPLIDRDQARACLGISADVALAVCVGRLCRQKGQDLLLSAWPKVLAALRPARGTRGTLPAQLVLVGDGPDRQRLERACPLGVRLVGAADPHAWYAAADVVVVPSRWEGMALVPLEAQASARLVVATDVDGMREGLHPEQLMVPPGRPHSLAAALTRALSDRSAAAAVGERARRLSEQQWSQHESRQRLRQIYTSAITAAQR